MQKTSVEYLEIPDERVGQRIDNFLLGFLKDIPRTRIYRLVRKGEVRVNKKRIDASYRLQAGDIVRVPPVEIRDERAYIPPSQSLMDQLASRILFEDAGFLIINKPSGIPVHGGSATPCGVVETLRSLYPKLPQLELVHRLDSDTSGCLILAKKRSVLRECHALLRDHQMVKRYWLLTKGHWKESDLRVDAALLKNQLSSGERIVRVNAVEGKPSVTIFRTLETFHDTSLMEATLETGRTHQIRVHARHKGHPIVGDEKYGDREFDKKMRDEIGLKRLFLHAASLDFTLPSTGQVVHVEAPLDNELNAPLMKLRG